MLQVGVMLDATSAPAWVRHVLQSIDDSAVATLRVAIVNAEPPSRVSIERVKRWSSRLVYRAYERADRTVFAATPDAFRVENLDDLLSDVEVMHVVPLRRGFVHRFDESVIQTLRERRLDVLLRFGFNIIKGEVLGVPKYGVWSYHHGDNREFRGGPPFFWEMFERVETSGVILQVLNDELDGGLVIYKSISATDLTSLNRGRNAAYWKGAHFVDRCLRDLHKAPENFFESRLSLQAPNSYTKRLYRTPTNLTMLVFLGRLLRRALQRGVSRLLWRDQWALGVRRVVDASLPVATTPFSVHVPPSDRFYADPFPTRHDDEDYVFFEEFPYKTRVGFISVARVTAAKTLIDHRPALAAGHHVSYPFIFRDGQHTYLIPEAHEAEEIAIYRSVNFPDEWARFTVVHSNIAAVDPTLLRWQDRYWLFCNVAATGMSPNDELHVFHASALTGPWVPHDRNPIVSDATRARPAGAPFVYERQLIRPAQDCSGVYGRAVRLLKVHDLRPDRYEESEVAVFEAPPGARVTGVHTYNRSGHLEVVDLRLQQRRFRTSWAHARSIKDVTLQCRRL